MFLDEQDVVEEILSDDGEYHDGGEVPTSLPVKVLQSSVFAFVFESIPFSDAFNSKVVTDL